MSADEESDKSLEALVLVPASLLTTTATPLIRKTPVHITITSSEPGTIVRADERTKGASLPSAPTPASAPVPASAPRRKLSKARTSHVPEAHGAPLANPGDFYRVLPSFSLSGTPDSSPGSRPVKSSTSFFPKQEQEPSARANSTSSIDRRLNLDGNGFPLVLNSTAAAVDNMPIPKLQPQGNDGMSGTVIDTAPVLSSPSPEVHSSISRVINPLATKATGSRTTETVRSSVRSNSIPSPDFGREGDVYGIPKQYTLRKAGQSATGGHAIYAMPRVAEGERDGYNGEYHGRAEPMYPMGTPSSPVKQMEITADFPSFPTPTLVPMPTPTLAPSSSQPFNTIAPHPVEKSQPQVIEQQNRSMVSINSKLFCSLGRLMLICNYFSLMWLSDKCREYLTWNDVILAAPVSALGAWALPLKTKRL